MELQKFLKINNMSARGFAALCGLSNLAIHKIMDGNDVQLSSILKIYKATNGNVGPFDLPYAKKNLKDTKKDSLEAQMLEMIKDNPKKVIELLMKLALKHNEEDDEKPDYTYQSEECEPS